MNNQSFTKARKIMLESQIRPNKVIDEMVLSAFATEFDPVAPIGSANVP